MTRPLNLFMITHHRRYRTRGRSLLIARQMAKRGHQTTLMVTANQARWKKIITREPGLTIVEMPDLLWGKLRSGWDLWALVNRLLEVGRDASPYDLVHCFETRPNSIYPAMTLARRRNIPLITDWNDWFGRGGLIEVLRPRWYRVLFGGLETYYEEAFRARADGLTVISRALAERGRSLGIPADKICLLPGGTDPDLYPAREKMACRQHMGYPADAPILGFASADSYLDVNILLDALARVAQRYADARLIITGEVKAEVLAAARQAGVQERLILPGFLPVEELSWCLGSADVLLLPFSDTIYNVGRWPNKVGVYMCLARPIVTNAVGDLRPLLAENAIGLTCEYSAQDFADKICWLLENENASREMGAQGLRLAQTRFHWSNLVQGLESYYYQILGEQEGKV